jgi:nucleotide-binding universal stress UspA family protein
MYKHILIPTDGSATVEKAVNASLAFAKWAKAKVTVFTAMPELRTPTSSEIAAAEKNGCDLIFIGSRGRKGISALLLGSQTHELLNRSRIPTLVYR